MPERLPVVSQGFGCGVAKAPRPGMSSDSLDKDDVEAAMSTMKSSGKDAYLATRQIRVWKKAGEVSGDDDTLVRLYLALKHVGGDGYRMNAKDFKKWETTVVKSTSIRRKLWMVPKMNLSDQEVEELRKYMLHPDDVVDWPCDSDDIYVLDQVVPREKLGVGVLEFMSGITRHKKLKTPHMIVESDSVTTPALMNLPAAVVPATVIPRPHVRVLLPRPSETEEDAAEKIAIDTYQAFEYRKIYSNDPLRTTVVFWCKNMMSHLQTIRKSHPSDESFYENLSDWCSEFWKCLICIKKSEN